MSKAVFFRKMIVSDSRMIWRQKFVLYWSNRIVVRALMATVSFMTNDFLLHAKSHRITYSPFNSMPPLQMTLKPHISQQIAHQFVSLVSKSSLFYGKPQVFSSFLLFVALPFDHINLTGLIMLRVNFFRNWIRFNLFRLLELIDRIRSPEICISIALQKNQAVFFLTTMRFLRR